MTPTAPMLTALLDECAKLVVDEMGKWVRIARQVEGRLFRAPKHPFREGHLQSVLFAGLRAAGHYTLAESNYFGRPTARQIDLVIQLADPEPWLLLEIKPCTTLRGVPAVRGDAEKLTAADPTDPLNKLRGLLVYGFGSQRYRCSLELYQQLGDVMRAKGFHEVGVRRKPLDGPDFTHVQLGLWVLGAEPS